jgi:hypothetical protein
MEYYSALEGKILSFVATRMNLEDITLREISHDRKANIV